MLMAALLEMLWQCRVRRRLMRAGTVIPACRLNICVFARDAWRTRRSGLSLQQRRTSSA